MNKKSVNELRKENGLEPIKDSICDEEMITPSEIIQQLREERAQEKNDINRVSEQIVKLFSENDFTIRKAEKTMDKVKSILSNTKN